MTVGLSCFAGVGWQLSDSNGNPLAGGLVYTYEAGTTTPVATYTTSAGNVAHSNPIVLDAAGRIPGGEVWLTLTSSYKFVVETSTGILIATYDNVPGISSASELANASNPAKGDALVGFRQSNLSGNLPDTVDRTVHDKLQEFISIKDFGAVGDGVANDTAAIQTALNQANKKTVIFPSGRYLIDALEVNQQFTSIWSQGAELVLNPSGTYTHAMKIATAGSFCTITGSLTFDGGLNSNYDSTFWVKGGYGKFENINFRFCKLALRIGEAGVNQVSLSEMFFSKIVTNGCRNALEMYGLFTVTNFTDCLFAGNEHPTWNGQDGTTIKNFGGRIYYENGYLYGGPASDPTLKPHIEINQIEYAGLFYTGSIYLNNLDSESYGKPFLQVNNLSTVNNAPTSGDVFICNSRIDFFNYGGMVPQPIPFYFNNFYTGSFKTINNRFKFFDNMTRRPIEIGANTRAQINVEDIVANFPYYGTNAIVYPGLPPQIPFQTVLSVTMNNPFIAGAGGGGQPVIFDTKRDGVQGNRITLSDNYDTSTGVFTVPKGGLSSIVAIANYRIASSLVCWGDSLTQGVGGTPYPTQLQHISGYPSSNQGVAGETSTQIKNRCVAANPDPRIAVIWVGRNNFTETATIMSDIADMVASLGHDRYIVMTIINVDGEIIGTPAYDQIIAVNNLIMSTYGSKALDIRTLLVNAYNPAIPQDVTDHANDVVPTSLKSDPIHLNSQGYLFVANAVETKLNELYVLGDIAVAYFQHFSSSGGFTRVYGFQPIVALGGQVTANIPEALEGDEITFVMDTQNSGAALDVGANFNNQMTISAYITTPNE